MSNAEYSPNSQVTQLPSEVEELLAAIEALPADHRERIEPIAKRVLASTKRRRRILNLVQDALSQLRLDMKYLLFDLEATRRERDEYRERLEEQA
ncbi:MAG: transcriptional regulator [Planctomycetales bacterium]|nr:transcriptional regulator [Planctomycetales bacterium]NIP69123.1 transcriptional regulator [Planctomycetales bacterium]